MRAQFDNATRSGDDGGTMMNKLHAMVVDEQRQLITFGFAVLVFLMTLFAQHLHNQGSTLGRVGSAGDQHASHASRNDGSANHGNRTIALAAMPTVDLR